MKVRTRKQNKVNVVTLGCSKNIVDSEHLMGQLKANDFEVDHDSNTNDHSIVVINTCGFIADAKAESIDTILTYAAAKDEGMVDKLYVTGCLSQRYKDDLIKEIPQVDAFFGTKEMAALLKTMNADYKKELIGERLQSTPMHYAYLKIAEGCDKQCSFCAIPLMRGKHVSLSIEHLVKEATSLAKRGVKELILIAQELNYYGKDLYNERRLGDLVKALAEVEGIEWIRLHYAYPVGMPMDVFEFMRDSTILTNYLDIPLQHVSDNVLKSMRRATNKKTTYDIINNVRALVPDINIRTTLLVGYPGETEADFEELCDFLYEMKLERVGVFTYSHEENTHAGEMEDDVPEDIKQQRANRIMEIQGEISLELNQARIDKKYNVIFDRYEGDHMIGRTEYDSPEVDNEVLVPCKEGDIKVGSFHDVIITDATEFDLFGELV